MRFEVSRALDAVEGRLRTDPFYAGAVCDLAEIVRLADLDGGRPASLLRLGLLIDALGSRLADEAVGMYAVADRALLSDTDLTSNERMVVRRWFDDGLVEVVQGGARSLPRAIEVAELTGLPLITRVALPGAVPTRYTPVPSPGGAALDGRLPAAGDIHPALTRLWHCPAPDCPGFAPARGVAQSAPTLAGGVPACPRHGGRLLDAGRRPAALTMVVRVRGLARLRFVVDTTRPVVVGRSPDGPGDVMIGPYLDEDALWWISRRHLQLELRPDGLTATDLSTNGTVRVAGGRPGEGHRSALTPAQPTPISPEDTIELHQSVRITRAGWVPIEPVDATAFSVMSDAPTRAMRLPNLS